MLEHAIREMQELPHRGPDDHHRHLPLRAQALREGPHKRVATNRHDRGHVERRADAGVTDLRETRSPAHARSGDVFFGGEARVRGDLAGAFERLDLRDLRENFRGGDRTDADGLRS